MEKQEQNKKKKEKEKKETDGEVLHLTDSKLGLTIELHSSVYSAHQLLELGLQSFEILLKKRKLNEEKRLGIM